MKISKLLDRTFLKFLLVGVVNTLFGTAVMFFSYNILNCNYWVSSALNYILGSILSYFLNKHFTFQNTVKSISIVIKFVINICVCYFIAYGIAKPLIMTILVNYTQKVQENAAMLIGMCLFVIINYIGQRFFVFMNQKTE